MFLRNLFMQDNTNNNLIFSRHISGHHIFAKFLVKQINVFFV